MVGTPGRTCRLSRRAAKWWARESDIFLGVVAMSCWACGVLEGAGYSEVVDRIQNLEPQAVAFPFNPGWSMNNDQSICWLKLLQCALRAHVRDRDGSEEAMDQHGIASRPSCGLHRVLC